MFSFRNCENGHSLVINSHLLNPNIHFVIIRIFNQANEVHSAGWGSDLIRPHLFSADPTHALVPKVPTISLPGTNLKPTPRAPTQTASPPPGSEAAAGRARPTPGHGFKKNREFLPFCQQFCRQHLFSILLFFFFSLNRFYKLLKSFSLFSDN